MERHAISSPLLKGVPEVEIQKVLGTARRRRFKKGEIVFHEGDPGDTLHVVAQGRFVVKVTTIYGDTVTLSVLGPGDVFGEMALLDTDVARSATVNALEQSETLSIRRSDFEELRRNYPAVNEFLLSILTFKVRRYTERLVEALHVPAEVRVVRRLLELVDIYDSDESGTLVPLLQSDLAELAGTSRATVNRVLRKEEELGGIRLERGKIRVLDSDRLERRAVR